MHTHACTHKRKHAHATNTQTDFAEYTVEYKGTQTTDRHSCMHFACRNRLQWDQSFFLLGINVISFYSPNNLPFSCNTLVFLTIRNSLNVPTHPLAILHNPFMNKHYKIGIFANQNVQAVINIHLPTFT